MTNLEENLNKTEVSALKISLYREIRTSRCNISTPQLPSQVLFRTSASGLIPLIAVKTETVSREASL
jgi:hypothetical protein